MPPYITPAGRDFSAATRVPPDLTARRMVSAIAQLQARWACADRALRRTHGCSFRAFLGGDEAAACSQQVSRAIVSALAGARQWHRGAAQEFPDLRHATRPVALEVKANRYPNPPQGHRARSGWYLVIRYELNAREIPEIREIRIGYVRKARLRCHGRAPGATRDPTATLRLADLPVWYSSLPI